MTHFLDTLPLDFSLRAVQELRSFLASNYYREEPVEGFVKRAGISPASIGWGRPMNQVWDQLLDTARKQDKLRALLDVIRKGDDAAVAARLTEWLAADPVTSAPAADSVEAWKGFGDTDSLERQIAAESALLDVAFLQRGVELAPSVARLLVTLAGQQYYGTAFRIGPDLLLTNHHVLFDKSGTPATAVDAWFGYERSFAGELLAHTTIAGDPKSIVGDATHDWAAIKVAAPMPDNAPVIELVGAKPVSVDERVYIIQHPNGGTKKIGMVHNNVRHVDDTVVQYWTDTEGGSSGSPVFNEQWQLVALHHKWVETRNDGKVEYRNQGRRIERVVDGLNAEKVLAP